MKKKIKLQEGSYKYKGFYIEKQEPIYLGYGMGKSYVHWNIGTEDDEYGNIDWHDATNTLKDAIAFIDKTYCKN